MIVWAQTELPWAVMVGEARNTAVLGEQQDRIMDMILHTVLARSMAP